MFGAGLSSMANVFAKNSATAQEDIEFDPFNRLQFWTTSGSFWQWNSFHGLATMVDAMNAVCQLKFYEENVKILATKFSLLTSKGGIMQALQGEDEELRPYLAVTGQGLQSDFGLGQDTLAKFGVNDRAAMFGRLAGIDPENIHTTASQFTQMWGYIQNASIRETIQDNVIAFVDNMQNLDYDGFSSGYYSMFKYAAGGQKLDIKATATRNVMAKYFRKIRSVIYIIDKFVKYERSIALKKKILDTIRSETLRDLKKESWKDALRSKVGGNSINGLLAANADGSITMVNEPASDRAQRMFGRLSNLTESIYSAREQDYFTQAGMTNNHLQSMLKNNPIKASNGVHQTARR